MQHPPVSNCLTLLYFLLSVHPFTAQVASCRDFFLPLVDSTLISSGGCPKSIQFSLPIGAATLRTTDSPSIELTQRIMLSRG